MEVYHAFLDVLNRVMWELAEEGALYVLIVPDGDPEIVAVVFDLVDVEVDPLQIVLAVGLAGRTHHHVCDSVQVEELHLLLVSWIIIT